MGNGCVVHWDKVPDICWHVMLWLVSNNVVSLPPKWSAATIAGPSVRGRDRHYVDGSALLRDRQPGASKHALAKIARSALDMHVGSVLREREREKGHCVCPSSDIVCV